MSNLTYQGSQSTTYRLVLLAFLTATAMLGLGKISGSEWVSGALGLVSAYVVRELGAGAAEAYRDKPTIQVPPQSMTATMSSKPQGTTL